MNVRTILEQAVSMAWRYRILWVFGVVLALFGRGAGSNYLSLITWNVEAPEWLVEPPPAVVIAIAVVAVLWVLVVLFVNHWAVAALIASINGVAEGRMASLGEGARTGLARFWTLLGITFAIGVPLVVAIVALIAPVVASFVVGLGLLGICFICLVVPLGIALSVGATLLLALAQVSAVVARTGVFASIRYSWLTIRDNLGSILLLWLVNSSVGCGWGCLGGAAVSAGLGVAGLAFAASPALGAVSTLLLVPLAAVLLLVSGVLEVFHESVWTLVYRQARLGGEGPGV